MGIPAQHIQLLRLLKIFRMKITATVFALLAFALFKTSAKNLVTFKEPTDADAEMLDLSHDIMYPKDYDELQGDEELVDSRRKRNAEEEEDELIDLPHDYIVMPEDYDELEGDEELEKSRRKRSAEEEEDNNLVAADRRTSHSSVSAKISNVDLNYKLTLNCDGVRSNIRATYTCGEELDVSDKLKEICEGENPCSSTLSQLVGERNCSKTETLPCDVTTYPREVVFDDHTMEICKGNAPIDEELKDICEYVNNPPPPVTERFCYSYSTIGATIEWSYECNYPN